MKKYILLTAFMILVSSLTFDAMGMDNNWPGKKKGWTWGNNNGAGAAGNHNTGAVGAPLDGGLLVALGVAGVAYVAARKKKKGIDE